MSKAGMNTAGMIEELRKVKSYFVEVASTSKGRTVYDHTEFREQVKYLSELIEVAPKIDILILIQCLSYFQQLQKGIQNIVDSSSIVLLEVPKKISELMSTDFTLQRQKWYHEILPLITEYRLDDINFALRAADAKLSDSMKKAESEFQQVSHLHKQLEKRLEDFDMRYSSQIQKLETIYQQDKFETNAKKFFRNGIVWLIISVLAGMALMYVANLFFIKNINEWNYFKDIKDVEKYCPECFETVLYIEAFKAIVFRLLIISLLIYALTFGVRNYNAQMHNYAVNLHKSNSLYASGVLMHNANTPEGKEALTIQAANAIFQQQATGYNQKDINSLERIAAQANKIVHRNSKS